VFSELFVIPAVLTGTKYCSCENHPIFLGFLRDTYIIKSMAIGNYSVDGSNGYNSWYEEQAIAVPKNCCFLFSNNYFDEIGGLSTKAVFTMWYVGGT